MIDRDKVEKDRLAERREKFSSYNAPGAVVAPDARDSALYISDTDRFFTDFASEQRHIKAEAQQKKQAELLRRRADAAAREEVRWAEMEAEARAFDEKTLALQADGRPALKNKSGQPFDPITKMYKNGEDGALLRFVDERTKWKAAARAEYLAAHSTAVDYDPVTGVPKDGRTLFKAPPPPNPADVGLPKGMSAEEAFARSKRFLH
jgi:hypothetical protein